jgi:large subunit ribosomal protein L10
MAQQQMAAPQAHVAPWKKEEVRRLQEAMKEAPIVAIVGIGGIPSPQMLKMRAMLREHGHLRSGKNNLFEIAIAGVDKDREGIKGLLEHMEGQCAILTTDQNPFKLYKQLAATKQMMPAKAGDIAPFDIVVPAGDTPFKPGPIVGELQKGGIPAAIEQGKVVVKKTVTVAKEGEAIPGDTAAALAKLEINPIEVGLDLRAVYEDGFVFAGNDLKIDEVAFGADLVRSIQHAVNLGVNAEIFTTETAPLIVAKAHREALNLAVEAGWLSKATTDLVLGKATRHALGIAGHLSDEALDEDLKTRIAGAAAAAAAAPAATESKEEAKEEEEEEEVSEEEAAAGLGSLFG